MKKMSYPEHPFNQLRQPGAAPLQPGNKARITPAQATAQANIVLAMLLLCLLSSVCWFIFA